MKKPILVGSLSVVFSFQAASARPSQPKVLVETDPVTFATAGYSAHVRVPLSDSGIVFGAGLYGMKLPDVVVNLQPKNADAGYHLELDKSYAAFFDYHFSGRPEGVFVGVQAALQRHRITQGADSAATEVGVALIMPRVGILWHPFAESSFYLLPWLGAGPAIEAYRTNDVHASYRSLPVLAFGTFHLGWEF